MSHVPKPSQINFIEADTSSRQPFIERLEDWYANAIYDSREVPDQTKAVLVAKHEILQHFPNNQFPGKLFDVIRQVNCCHVGEMWIWPMSAQVMRVGFIHINPKLRRNGFGRVALLKAEEYARTQGAQKLRLNVFPHHQHVFRLYQDLGYQIINTVTSPSTQRVTRHEMEKIL